jgi:NADH dehydrogenase
VRVESDLTVKNHPEIFVIGDTASLGQEGKPLPGVAQVAMQQGRYAGNLIRKRATGKPPSAPFRYFDKGNLAVVGKGFAVLQSGKVCLSGFLAWLVWAAIHLEFLATSSLRVSVFVQWVWTYVTGQRGSRLIVKHHSDWSWHLEDNCSSAYYPGQYRTWTKIGQRRLTSVILDTATFAAKEFWPDVNAIFHRKN